MAVHPRYDYAIWAVQDSWDRHAVDGLVCPDPEAHLRKLSRGTKADLQRRLEQRTREADEALQRVRQEMLETVEKYKKQIANLEASVASVEAHKKAAEVKADAAGRKTAEIRFTLLELE